MWRGGIVAKSVVLPKVSRFLRHANHPPQSFGLHLLDVVIVTTYTFFTSLLLPPWPAKFTHIKTVLTGATIVF